MKPAHQDSHVEFIHADFHRIRIDVHWYRWEFLRRNPHYRVDYEEFVEKFGKWLSRKGYWYDDVRYSTWTEGDERYFKTKILPAIGALCEKWQITNLISPSWGFDRRRGLRRIPGGMVEIPTIVAPGWKWDPSVFRTLVRLGFLGTADLAKRHGNVVLAEFDLNWPMKDLLEYAKRVLSYAYENYKKELGRNKVDVLRGRRRLRDYDTHLRVWDLKAKGKSVPEIAKAVFPLYSSRSAVQRVRDHLRAANRLVLGHPTDIR